MTDLDAYRERITQMSPDELAVEWVVMGSLFRRLSREIEQLGLAGVGGVRPADAKHLFGRYLGIDARFDLVDDLARERILL